jgi:agmatine/peptidylarginine deiminase
MDRSAFAEKVKQIQQDKGVNSYQHVRSKNFVVPNEHRSAKYISKPTDSKLNALPEGIRTPGEFEEMQAVMIQWPSYSFDKDTNQIYPYYGGKGDYPNQQTGQWEERDIAFEILDLYPQYSEQPVIWSQLANAIQQQAEVWIVIPELAAGDTVYLKQYMASLGTPLTNHRFILAENSVNGFWMRDYGPWGFYYGQNNDLAFADFKYYPGRPLDDEIPELMATLKGYPRYDSPVEIEGGNFMTDGFGNGIYSNVLYSNNADEVGQFYEYKEPMNKAKVDEEMAKILGLKNNIVLQHLQYDGGTGHIDIYLKQYDHESMIATEYPEVMSNSTDYKTVQNNLDLIASYTTTNGTPYYVDRIFLPHTDQGTYVSDLSKSGNEYLQARGFVNGLFVNKTFIFPAFSNDQDGYSKDTEEAIARYKEILPGYNIVPIDSRYLAPMGGAIHCITMQIPAENPVLYKHKSYRGAQKEKNIYKFEVEIENHSGIEVANLFFRVKNSGNDWQKVELAPTGNTFLTAVDMTTFSNQDTIEYYFASKTNNGKETVYPITAPDGFFTFWFDDNTSVNDNLNFGESKVYPNPMVNEATLEINSEIATTAKVSLYDLVGVKIADLGTVSLAAGINKMEFVAPDLTSGMYLLRIDSAEATTMLKISIAK